MKTIKRIIGQSVVDSVTFSLVYLTLGFSMTASDHYLVGTGFLIFSVFRIGETVSRYNVYKLVSQAVTNKENYGKNRLDE